jgi:demethylmenaquinone methyltransferase/2-methoxy-6-polyprenyl-1,4-benzoquinol methylase
LLSGNQDKAWRRRAVRLLSPRRGERVLDVCCGTGDLALECRRRQPCCEVIGADFAAPMLQLAHEKSVASTRSGAGHKTLPLAVADALHQPFHDETFDAVMVAFGARNFENTFDGLREMHRVTKRGGRVLVLEFMRPTLPLLRVGFGFFFKRVLPIIGRIVSRHCSAYNYLPASVDGFYTRDEFTVLLRRSGFQNVRAFDYSGGIATCFVARRPVIS